MSVDASSEVRRYRRRSPETSLLHQTVSEHLEPWLSARDMESASTGKSGLPVFVANEMRAYLRCGILDYGFLRMSCLSCREDTLVAFSCKKRGFCPSCGAKRSAEVVTHLCENILPRTAYRQWVITLPHALRWMLARSTKLTALVHAIVSRRVSKFYVDQARSVSSAEPGGVTFIQRFGSALNLNVHFHIVMIEGVYARVCGTAKHFPGRPTPMSHVS